MNAVSLLRCVGACGAIAMLAACDKTEAPKPDPTPATTSAEAPPAPASTTSASVATTDTTASAAASAAPSAPAAPSASTASGAASAKPAASGATPAAAASGPAPKLEAASTTVSDANYDLVVATPGCAVGQECTLALRLATKGDYHINKEYPYKFTGAPAGPVTFVAKGAPNVFSKASGDFAIDGETRAVMNVRYRASEAGKVTLAGTYKMSVCSADQCRIVDPKVSLQVAVR
ncbi:MAG: hypothetical protein R3B36_07880 [Polyangiaceae bacterium]